MFFFFNDTATTEIYTLSLHDALPISAFLNSGKSRRFRRGNSAIVRVRTIRLAGIPTSGRRLPIVSPTACAISSGCRTRGAERSEEHTSELQSRQYLVCRLLLEKKKYR